jgi:putative transposase
MRASRFREEQIVGILREHEAGAKTPELCRRHGISDATLLHLWTAPPWQEGFGPVLTRIDCKHLSGVAFLWCAQMGNPLTPSSTSGRPRGPL